MFGITYYDLLTEDEKRQVEEYSKKDDDLAEQRRVAFEKLKATDPQDVQKKTEILTHISELGKEQVSIEQSIALFDLAAERRYIAKNLTTTDAIVESAKKTLATQTKDKYLIWQTRTAEAYKPLTENILAPSATEEEKAVQQRAIEFSQESTENCALYLLQVLRMQLNACKQMDNQDAQDIIVALADARAAELLDDRATQTAAERRRAAEAAGAITTIGSNLVTFTDDRYRYALTQRKNAYAYVQALKPGADPLSITELDNVDDQKYYSDIDENLNPGALKILLTAINNNLQKLDGDTAAVYWPGILEEININTRGDRPDTLMQDLKAYEQCIGIIGGSIRARVLTVLSYDTKTKIATINMPYLSSLQKDFAAAAAQNQKGKYNYNRLLSARSAKRGAAAQELAEAIVILVATAGKKNGPAHKVAADLIAECPVFKYQLDNTETTANKNTKIKRTFEQAYKILLEDLAKEYKGLKIDGMIPAPTTTTLDRVISVSWTRKQDPSKAEKTQKTKGGKKTK